MENKTKIKEGRDRLYGERCRDFPGWEEHHRKDLISLEEFADVASEVSHVMYLPEDWSLMKSEGKAYVWFKDKRTAFYFSDVGELEKFAEREGIPMKYW